MKFPSRFFTIFLLIILSQHPSLRASAAKSNELEVLSPELSEKKFQSPNPIPGRFRLGYGIERVSNPFFYSLRFGYIARLSRWISGSTLMKWSRLPNPKANSRHRSIAPLLLLSQVQVDPKVIFHQKMFLPCLGFGLGYAFVTHDLFDLSLTKDTQEHSIALTLQSAIRFNILPLMNFQVGYEYFLLAQDTRVGNGGAFVELLIGERGEL